MSFFFKKEISFTFQLSQPTDLMNISFQLKLAYWKWKLSIFKTDKIQFFCLDVIFIQPIYPVHLREGWPKKIPEKVWSFAKLRGGGGAPGGKKKQTPFLEKYFFSELVESF